MQSNEASIASALKFVQCGLPCRKREMRVTSKDASTMPAAASSAIRPAIVAHRVCIVASVLQAASSAYF